MNRSLVATTTATIALIAGSNASAQQASAASGGEATGKLEEIMVTAQRRSERLHDVPLSIIAKSGDDLEASGVYNLEDLQLVVPGFQMTTLAGFAHPVIRGVSTTVNDAGADTPTAIYVDGVYQSNKGSNLFELADVERIEVLKGPQGTLFGRNAVAGAVSIYTLDPTFEATGKFVAEAGSYDGAKSSPRYMVKGFVSFPVVDDKLAMSVSGFYEQVDGYLVDDRTGDRGGEIERSLGRVKFLFEPTDSMRFLLSGVYSSTDNFAGGAITPYKGNANAAYWPDGIVASKPWHYTTELSTGTQVTFTTYKAVDLKMEFDIGDAGTLTSTTGYTEAENAVVLDASAAYSPTCRANFGCVPFDAPGYDSDTFQQELTFASTKFGAFSFVAGAFLYRDYSTYVSQVFPVLNPDGSIDRSQLGLFGTDNDHTTEAWAGFGELNYELTDRMTLIAGIRYSDEEKYGWGASDTNVEPRHPYPSTGPRKDDAWTPRFSVRYDFSDALNAYATYSKGFKSALIDSGGATDAHADPENLTSYEVGVKWSTPTANINAAAFYYDYKDKQVYYFDGISSTLDNAATAEIIGLEADVSILLSDAVTLSLGGSWLPLAEYGDYKDAIDYVLPNSEFGMASVLVDLSGEDMLSTPEFTGIAAVAYEQETGWGTVDANANLYYSSGLDWDPLRRVQTDAYATVNLRFGITPIGKSFRVGLYANNLTNEEVITGYLLSALVDGVTYGEPRQFGISAQFSF